MDDTRTAQRTPGPNEGPRPMGPHPFPPTTVRHEGLDTEVLRAADETQLAHQRHLRNAASERYNSAQFDGNLRVDLRLGQDPTAELVVDDIFAIADATDVSR